MTDSRRQLAEDAARAMGRMGEIVHGVWTNAAGKPCPAPSLDDPAFCWAMAEWLREMADYDVMTFGPPGNEVVVATLHDYRGRDYPEALARAVKETA